MNYYLIYALIVFALTKDCLTFECKSSSQKELNPYNWEYCWNQFCLCPRFDNCSQLNNKALEDVLALLANRMKIVLCGYRNRFEVEPDVWAPVRYQLLFLKTIARVNSSIIAFDRFDYSFTNKYFGHQFSTEAIISGYFKHKYEFRNYLTSFETPKPFPTNLSIYYRLDYVFGDDQQKIESLIIGPISGMFDENKEIHFVLPKLLDNSVITAIHINISVINVANNQTIGFDLVPNITLNLRLNFCIKESIDDKSEIFWTSKDCSPVESSLYAKIGSKKDFFGNSEIECKCNSTIDYQSSTSTQTPDNRPTDILPDIETTDIDNGFSQKKKSESDLTNSLFAFLLLLISICVAIILTILFMIVISD